MADNQIPGAAIAIAENGNLLWAGGFGYRDLARQIPADENTIFGIGSITKSFTALAIMQLAEAGKSGDRPRLRLDDPVTRYLPKFRTPDVGLAMRSISS